MTGNGQPKKRSLESVDISDQEWGSDFVADLLKAYGYEYVVFNPGASFRGIEESIVNYNDNEPEVIEVQHEGLTVSVAHGYAKATNEPALCIMHDVVGTLNGGMGIYNAYVDRVPILILGGNGPLRKGKRRPWIDWIHTVLDQGNLVREYTKWDDQPAHTDGVAESIIRGHNISDTKPSGPVYVTLDHDVQENRLESPREIPNLDRMQPPTSMEADSEAIKETADRLIDAENPVIMGDLVGDSREAVDALVELAEAVGAPFVESTKRHRYNFPTTHPLYLTESNVLEEADLVLALDVLSLNYLLKHTNRTTHELREVIDHDFSLIQIGTHDLESSSLTGDYFAVREADISILADTALAIPELRDAVVDRLTDANVKRSEGRIEQFSRIHADLVTQWEQQVEETWDETPISLPRLANDIWEVIQDDEWVLVNGTLRGWPHRLWEINEYDKYIGGNAGGGGVGYGVGAAIGGALAYEETDRVPINLQPDGDLMQYLNGLWTMARYDIPLFSVVHNNRSLYNSTEHRMNLAEYRNREASYERALIGTGLDDPSTDYATAAESMGVSGFGPIENPESLKPTLTEAWSVAKGGSPVLVDVVSQPR